MRDAGREDVCCGLFSQKTCRSLAYIKETLAINISIPFSLSCFASHSIHSWLARIERFCWFCHFLMVNSFFTNPAEFKCFEFYYDLKWSWLVYYPFNKTHISLVFVCALFWFNYLDQNCFHTWSNCLPMLDLHLAKDSSLSINIMIST